MNPETEFVLMQFDVEGEILTASVPVQLVSRIYEDEEFKLEFINSIKDTTAQVAILPAAVTGEAAEEKFSWNDEATKLLLESYREELPKFRNPQIKKNNLWQKLSKKMMEHGHSVTADVCDKKFRNLKTTYRTIKDKISQTGRARQHWSYFTMMDELFATDSTVNPPLLLSSLKSRTTFTTKSGSASPISQSEIDLPSPQPSTSSAAPPEHCKTSEAATTSSKKKNRELQQYRERIIKIEEEKLQELREIKESYKSIADSLKERNELLKSFKKP